MVPITIHTYKCGAKFFTTVLNKTKKRNYKTIFQKENMVCLWDWYLFLYLYDYDYFIYEIFKNFGLGNMLTKGSST